MMLVLRDAVCAGKFVILVSLRGSFPTTERMVHEALEDEEEAKEKKGGSLPPCLFLEKLWNGVSEKVLAS